MNYLLILLVLFTSLNADKIKKKTLACPTIVQLKKAPIGVEEESINLTMYAIANGCVILGERDRVKAIGYDSLNSKEIYQKIVYENTGVYLYVLSSSLQIEQDGKKSSFRF